MLRKFNLLLRPKIFKILNTSPTKLINNSLNKLSFSSYQSNQLTLPYQFGNQLYLVQKINLIDPNMNSIFNFFSQLLRSRSYIQGFQRAYCHHLGNMAFKQIQTIQNTCDQLLSDRINDGISQIEDLDQKLVLISTGKKPYTSSKFKKILQSDQLPFTLKSEIVNMSVLSTPFFQKSIDKSRLLQVISNQFIKMYTEKANIFQLFGKMVKQGIFFKLVLQLTLKVQTNLILQSVSSKKKAEQIQHSGNEMHFIQFQGQIKEFNQSNVAILVQSFNKGSKLTDMFNEQFQMSNIFVTNFDNCLKDERWKVQQVQRNK